MAWYRSGTISILQGDKRVVGANTQFVSAIAPGYALLGPDLSIYEVASVISATELTLIDPYRGASAELQPYAIWQTQGEIHTLVQVTTTLLDTFGAFRAAYENGEFVGTGLALKGILESVDDLPTEGMVAGDAYLIGYEIYGWSGLAWVRSAIRGVQGEPGERGEQGLRGPAGPPNVLTIGEVTSGDVPAARIEGEAPQQILHLVLARGDKGERGEKGEGAYVLPVASETVLGGVMAGDNIAITEEGRISAKASPTGSIPFLLADGTPSNIPLSV